MEIEENGCSKGPKRKKPLDLDWKQLNPTSSGEDDPPPELVVGGEVDAPTEDLELMTRSEYEIRETITRLKNLLNIAKNLPDKGVKLKANLRRHEDELERRMKLQVDKADKGCEEIIQISRNRPWRQPRQTKISIY